MTLSVSLVYLDNGDEFLYNIFNPFIGILGHRAMFYKTYVIFNSSKRNQKLCFEVFHKKLLAETEPSLSI